MNLTPHTLDYPAPTELLHSTRPQSAIPQTTSPSLICHLIQLSFGMDNTPGGKQPLLTWSNVALALSFVAFDAILSSVYRLGISSSLIPAALRCIAQLSVMALLLESIFKTQNPYGIAGLARESCSKQVRTPCGGLITYLKCS